jgi:hypothetical protein
MDKKNVQNQTRRNTFGKNARGYNINGPKGLKERDDSAPQENYQDVPKMVQLDTRSPPP